VSGAPNLGQKSGIARHRIVFALNQPATGRIALCIPVDVHLAALSRQAADYLVGFREPGEIAHHRLATI